MRDLMEPWQQGADGVARDVSAAAEAGASASTDADEALLALLFCDESPAFCSPAAPDIGQPVTVRLRVERPLRVCSWVVAGEGDARVPMAHVRDDALFSWYEARLQCGFEPVRYRICVEMGEARRRAVCQRDGVHWEGEESGADCDFSIVARGGTPAWSQGAVLYQILPDRFANGDPSNDVVAREYAYEGQPVRAIAEWDAAPAADDYRCFYGGDLQGILGKLDYLQALGVEAIYLNPVFVSPSSHKYDTQDYWHIDPHLAVICDDEDHPLAEGAHSNEDARQYRHRTASQANLESSDELFARLCAEVHRRGMRIILDGVFNHCGSFNSWMDREGIYRAAGRQPAGAYQSPESPYRTYFHFDESGNYVGWWGYPTLPKLAYEHSAQLCEDILAIARHWASPPYRIDGWRLDVAADLGQSEEFNHRFWKRFRSELKCVNPDLLILAEHYGDPAAWLGGDEWDTVMNYDAFMEPLTYFLCGMEKHSDARDDGLYQDGAAFCATMRRTMARFSWTSLLSAMNELSNHDHSRFLTRTNRRVGRAETAGAAAAGEGIDKRVLREAIVVQMTWPGAPAIYYGDEAGQVGWTDPDSRRTYPWGHEDEGLIDLHRVLARMRRDRPCLRSGSHVLLGGGAGWIAFGRFLGEDCALIVCNNADDEQEICVRARALGVPDGCRMGICVETQEDGFVFREGADRSVGVVEDGLICVRAAARSALVLARLA